MTKELVISSNRHETRVAVLEDDQVVEVYFQRENEYSLAGSIHKGRVTRVLPGMQSAFVDIGLERDAFLYVSDFFEDNEEYDKIVTSVEEKILRLEKGVPAAAAGVAAAPAVENPAVKPAEAAAPEAAAPAFQRPDRRRRARSGLAPRRALHRCEKSPLHSARCCCRVWLHARQHAPCPERRSAESTGIESRSPVRRPHFP
jgi:ribonuclease G